MPTILWKKIGKGSWINIGGHDTFTEEIRASTFGRGRRRGRTIIELTAGGFFNSTASADRTIHTLRHMGFLPQAINPFNI